MNERIADAAESLVGTPFLHQGRNPNVGLDCVGLWVAALKAADIPVRDFTAYRKFPCAITLMAKLKEQFRLAHQSEAGDLIVMTVPQSTRARHVGIDVGGGFMVHADGARRLVVRSRIPLDCVNAVFRAEGGNG